MSINKNSTSPSSSGDQIGMSKDNNGREIDNNNNSKKIEDDNSLGGVKKSFIAGFGIRMIVILYSLWHDSTCMFLECEWIILFLN